jgi:hypothetical protein
MAQENRIARPITVGYFGQAKFAPTSAIVNPFVAGTGAWIPAWGAACPIKMKPTFHPIRRRISIMAVFDRRHLWTRVAATAALAGMPLLGCQNVQNSTPSQTQVRVIDASYNAPSVNVDVATTPIATNVGAASFTNYAFLPPENTAAYVFPTGSTTPSATAAGEFLVSEQHSVFITDSGNGYTASILTDQPLAAPTGYFSIRFLQQALVAGAVDIYLVPAAATLAGAKPVYTDVKPQSVVGYLNVPAGGYTIVVTPTGVITTPYTSAQITFVDGQVRTALIMDAQLTRNPPVTVVVGNDLN